MTTCPTCGAEVREGQKFCAECGYRLREPSLRIQAPSTEGGFAPGVRIGDRAAAAPVADGGEDNARSESSAAPVSARSATDGYDLGAPLSPADDDDFFSRYRRKGAGGESFALVQDPHADLPADLPLSRRSRRRFDPDLTTKPVVPGAGGPAEPASSPSAHAAPAHAAAAPEPAPWPAPAEEAEQTTSSYPADADSAGTSLAAAPTSAEASDARAAEPAVGDAHGADSAFDAELTMPPTRALPTQAPGIADAADVADAREVASRPESAGMEVAGAERELPERPGRRPGQTAPWVAAAAQAGADRAEQDAPDADADADAGSPQAPRAAEAPEPAAPPASADADRSSPAEVDEPAPVPTVLGGRPRPVLGPGAPEPASDEPVAIAPSARVPSWFNELFDEPGPDETGAAPRLGDAARGAMPPATAAMPVQDAPRAAPADEASVARAQEPVSPAASAHPSAAFPPSQPATPAQPGPSAPEPQAEPQPEPEPEHRPEPAGGFGGGAGPWFARDRRPADPATAAPGDGRLDGAAAPIAGTAAAATAAGAAFGAPRIPSPAFEAERPEAPRLEDAAADVPQPPQAAPAAPHHPAHMPVAAPMGFRPSPAEDDDDDDEWLPSWLEGRADVTRPQPARPVSARSAVEGDPAPAPAAGAPGAFGGATVAQPDSGLGAAAQRPADRQPVAGASHEGFHAPERHPDADLTSPTGAPFGDAPHPRTLDAHAAAGEAVLPALGPDPLEGLPAPGPRRRSFEDLFSGGDERPDAAPIPGFDFEQTGMTPVVGAGRQGDAPQPVRAAEPSAPVPAPRADDERPARSARGVAAGAAAAVAGAAAAATVGAGAAVARAASRAASGIASGTGEAASGAAAAAPATASAAADPGAAGAPPAASGPASAGSTGPAAPAPHRPHAEDEPFFADWLAADDDQDEDGDAGFPADLAAAPRPASSARGARPPRPAADGARRGTPIPGRGGAARPGGSTAFAGATAAGGVGRPAAAAGLAADGSGAGGEGVVVGLLRSLEQPERKRLFTILLAGLGAILLVASAFLIGGAIGARHEASRPSDAPTAAPSEAEQPPAEEPPAPLAPVADPSFEAVSFQSQSGNIACSIDPQIGVACQQYSNNFAIPDASCTNRSAIRGVVIGLDSNGYTWPCLEQNIDAVQTLPYDETITAGEFTCRLDYVTGVRCVNAAQDSFVLEYTAGVNVGGRASETGPTAPPTAAGTAGPGSTIGIPSSTP